MPQGIIVNNVNLENTVYAFNIDNKEEYFYLENGIIRRHRPSIDTWYKICKYRYMNKDNNIEQCINYGNNNDYCTSHKNKNVDVDFDDIVYKMLHGGGKCTIRIGGEDAKFETQNDVIVRYSDYKEKWRKVCLYNDVKQCVNYANNNINSYCTHHNKIKNAKIVQNVEIVQNVGLNTVQNVGQNVNNTVQNIGQNVNNTVQNIGQNIETIQNVGQNVNNTVQNIDLDYINSLDSKLFSEYDTSINDINTIEYPVSIRGEPEKFKINNGIISRYKSDKDSWILVCMSCTKDKRCTNYQINNGFCENHQKLIVRSENIPFFYNKILSQSYKICDYKNKTYRLSKTNYIWKETCIFIDKNNVKCFDYQTYGCYCDKHKNNIENNIGKKTTGEIGDESEKFILDILIDKSDFNDIKKIGRENTELDIIYKIKDEEKYRGIQIKTMVQRKDNKNSYKIDKIDKYSDSTLIVCVSKERDFLCVFLKYMLPGVKSLSLNINKLKNKTYEYKPYTFDGLDDNSNGYTFTEMLLEYSKASTVYENSKMGKAVLQERDSMNRLEKICTDNKISFKYIETSDSSIDCIINGKNIQCKSTSAIKQNFYNFSLHKTKNLLSSPYEDIDNIDFFIFEYVNNKNGEFYIIPINVMVYFGYIKTKINKGKLSITLCPFNHQNDDLSNHWSKHFINRFDLLKKDDVFDVNTVLDMSDVLNLFISHCLYYNIITTRAMDNLSSHTCTIKDKNVKCLKSTNFACLNLQFTIQSLNGIAYDTSMILPDFFVLYYIDGSNTWCYIFPKQILIDNGIIGDSTNKGITKIGLPVPGASDIKENKFWTQPYANNFALLNF